MASHPAQRTFWPNKKKHRHVMGEVVRVSYGTGTISALYLYEKSICRGQEPAVLPPMRARAIIGACKGLVCTECGEEVSWEEPPGEAYQRLMADFEKEK